MTAKGKASKKHSPETKAEAIHLCKQGLPKAGIAKRLNVAPSLISKWFGLYQDGIMSEAGKRTDGKQPKPAQKSVLSPISRASTMLGAVSRESYEAVKRENFLLKQHINRLKPLAQSFLDSIKET
jgi:transposase-like protein